MQKLQVRHTFACSPAEYWALVWDDAFDRSVNEAAEVTKDVLEDRVEGSERVVVSKTVPKRTLPAAVAAVVGTDRITYLQTTRYDAKAGRMTWEVVPSVFSDKISAKGYMEVVAHPTGCERVVDGTIEVRVMMVGGRIERAIVEDVERSYHKAAEAARKWLAGPG